MSQCSHTTASIEAQVSQSSQPVFDVCTCAIIVVHAYIMVVVHAYSLIIARACTMIMARACTMLIVHACNMTIVHVRTCMDYVIIYALCPTGLMFDKVSGSPMPKNIFKNICFALFTPTNNQIRRFSQCLNPYGIKMYQNKTLSVCFLV